MRAHRQDHRQAQREARRLRGAAVEPRCEERRDFRSLRAPVREAAGRRHLVHRHAALSL